MHWRFTRSSSVAWAYRWAGADPFAFAGAFRRDWNSFDHNRPLPMVTWKAGDSRWARPSHFGLDPDPRPSAIVRAMAGGRRVIVQSSAPIDDLARSVWHALPRSVRRRATVATWAFDNANRFDLVGMAKLAGVDIDRSDLILVLEHAHC